MTTAEIIKRLQTIRDIMQRGDFFYADAEVMTAAIEAINTSNGEKLYTVFEIIRLVQRAVSDEVCAMDANEAAIGYEIERSIIGKLVKEDGCETNV